MCFVDNIVSTTSLTKSTDICESEPETVKNAVFVISNNTATYKCNEGYKSSTSDTTVVCAKFEGTGSVLSWNTTRLVCTKGRLKKKIIYANKQQFCRSISLNN